MNDRSIISHLKMINSFSKEYLIELYNSLQTGNPENVNKSNQILLELQEKAKIEYLIFAAEILLSDDVSLFCINMAAVNIGQILSPNVYTGSGFVNDLWRTKVPDNYKSIIKEGVFRGLMFESPEIRGLCAMSLVKIAMIEIPNGEWLDFYQKLGLILSNDEYNDYAKMGCLQCFSEIFQTKGWLRKLFTKKYNINFFEITINLYSYILNVICNGVSTQELVIQAANCLNTFIPFICARIDLESFIKIMSSELEKSDITYNRTIFDILIKVIKCSYKHINQDLIKIILNGVIYCINSNDVKKVYHSIQFCTAISEVEYRILNTLENKADFCLFHNLTGILTELLIKTLLSFMSIIDEDDFDNSLFNISKKCIKKFTKIDIVAEAIVYECLNFFQLHFNDKDWKGRFSSIISILSIANTSVQILNDNIKFLLNCVIILFNNSDEIIVKKYILKLIKSILSHHFDISFDFEIMKFIIEIIQNGVSEIEINALRVLSVIIKKIQNLDEQMLNNLFSLLFQTINNNDIFNDNFLEVLTNTIVSLVQSIPKENNGFIQSIYSIVINKFHSCLQVVFPEQTSQFRILCCLISILQNIIFRFDILSANKSDVIEITIDLINILYTLIENSSMLDVEALKLITFLVLNFSEIFYQDFQRLEQILIRCLNCNSPELVSLSGRLIGDLFKLNFKEQLLQFIDSIVEVMLIKIQEFLYLPYISLSLFFAIGDIISVLPDYFSCFIPKIIQIIQHFNTNVNIPENDEELLFLFLETLLYVSTRIILLKPSLVDIQSCKILFFMPIKKYYIILLNTPDYVKNYFLNFILSILSNPEIKNFFDIQIHSSEVEKIIKYYSNSSNENILNQINKIKNYLKN